MGPRLRTVIALVSALAVVGLVVPASVAKAKPVPKVYGLAAAGSNLTAAKLGLKWRKVTGASYQVRWASSTKALPKAKVYVTTKTSATSPTLSNTCATWYAQVRAKKGGKLGPWSAARALKFANKVPVKAGILAAKFAGVGVPNGVKFTWGAVPNATRYKVEWDAAPFGKFTPSKAELIGGDWITQRTATLGLKPTPAAGDRMMGAAYGNPVYARLIANNKCFTGYTITDWVPVFPGALSPGAGDPLRVGSYNLERTPSNAKVDEDGPERITAFAANIGERDLDVLLLQESSSDTVADLIAALALAGEAGWAAVPPAAGSQQQILYRNTKYSLVTQGTFGQVLPPSAAVPNVTPWARLHSLLPDDGNARQDLFVVSPHLAQDFDGFVDGSNPQVLSPVEQRANKKNAGLAATALLTGIRDANVDKLPVVAAGDFKYLREPFQEVPGEIEAPPTFTRGLSPGEGFYDAINSKNASAGTQFTTVNRHAAQTPMAYGVASRSDYIFLKGFAGSLKYVNVANQPYPAVSWKGSDYPSDHNLIYADVVVPFK